MPPRLAIRRQSFSTMRPAHDPKMTPEQLAALHARAFTKSRPWSTAEFSALLASPHCFAVTEAHAFALGRVVADEAELLTLASDPEHQRQGHARKCLYLFEKEAQMRGATMAFLEVAEDNSAALALYRAAGYHIKATRPAYYNHGSTAPIDALVMARLLGEN